MRARVMESNETRGNGRRGRKGVYVGCILPKWPAGWTIRLFFSCFFSASPRTYRPSSLWLKCSTVGQVHIPRVPQTEQLQTRQTDTTEVPFSLYSSFRMSCCCICCYLSCHLIGATAPPPGLSQQELKRLAQKSVGKKRAKKKIYTDWGF